MPLKRQIDTVCGQEPGLEMFSKNFLKRKVGLRFYKCVLLGFSYIC